MILRFRRALLIATLGLLGASVHAQADGAAVYQSTCQSCHQAGGQGVSGVFPPLGEHLAEIYEAEDGPRYLANVVLFGIEGPIVVEGATYNGIMPSWFQLGDDEIAAVLNHVMTNFGAHEALTQEFTPYEEDDVAAARRGGLSPQLVHQRRPDLGDSAGEATSDVLPKATFSQIQVDRIRPIYDRQCMECHGAGLDGGLIGGPPLRGAYFEQRWAGRPVAALFRYTQAQMPLDRPGSLNPQQYADLVALILSVNGHEATGTELSADPAALEDIGILSAHD